MVSTKQQQRCSPTHDKVCYDIPIFHLFDKDGFTLFNKIYFEFKNWEEKF